MLPARPSVPASQPRIARAPRWTAAGDCLDDIFNVGLGHEALLALKGMGNGVLWKLQLNVVAVLYAN